MSRFTVTVHMEFKSYVSATQCNKYVRSAIQSECGMRNPDTDNTSDLIRDSVKVKATPVRDAT